LQEFTRSSILAAAIIAIANVRPKSKSKESRSVRAVAERESVGGVRVIRG